MDLTRKFIYQELYDKVIKWAKKEFEETGRRATNGKPLHKNFPCALSEYIKEIRGKNEI